MRAPDGELQPTVFPLPVRPLSELTPQMRRTAIEATYTGRLQDAVDITRQVITEDGYLSGIVATMSHGILGMPHTFQGDEQMIAALDDAGGTPSEYTAMHPESECAQIFADGLVFLGLGQYVYDHGAPRSPGGNRLPRLEWRDPRWLWRNPITMQWYWTSSSGMRPINPGDGEWFMFQPYPDVDTWRHGPWLYITLAGIFARDAAFDRQRVSEVTTPTPYMRATKPTSKEARKEALKQLQDLAHDHRIVLPEQWEYDIASVSGDYKDVAQSIIDWAMGAVEVGLTGNLMGLKAQSAFTDASVYKRTTTDRRRFFAQAWCDTVRTQGLRYWGADNYGRTNVPVVKINVESPEDKLAAAKADTEDGNALKALQEGYGAAGFALAPDYVIERAQRRGLRLVRVSAQVPPSAPVGGQPTVATPTPPSPASPPAAPAPASEDDEPAAREDGPRGAVERAAAMNAHGIAACRHNRTNVCETCGVRGHWMPAAGGAWAVTWEPLAARVTA